MCNYTLLDNTIFHSGFHIDSFPIINNEINVAFVKNKKSRHMFLFFSPGSSSTRAAIAVHFTNYSRDVSVTELGAGQSPTGVDIMQKDRILGPPP